MRAIAGLALTTVATLVCSSCGMDPLDAAAENLGVETVNSIRIEGTGANFSVGQPYTAGQEWPRVDIVSYTAVVDFASGSMEVDMVREQPEPQPPGGGIRFPGQQRVHQFVSGGSAWNQPPPAADGTEREAQARPGAAVERSMQIIMTPQGFVKAALAAGAVADETGEVSFTAPSGNLVFGTIDEAGDVTRVQTWIDNPVFGDMLVETTFSDYQDFGGIRFPARIAQTHGGHPALDLTIAGVTPNVMALIEVPANVASFQPELQPVTATSERVANGIFYIKGGSHHSVAIEMSDHVVVVEGPQSEARGLAVIEAVGQAIPGKPIRFVVNTHVHFDHSSGLRPFAAEGATVVTHESNVPFYQSAWAARRTLGPDRLSESGVQPEFMGVGDLAELTDGRRRIEIHRIADSAHNTGFLMVWMPQERILIEADAFTPGPAGAPPPETPNPNTVNLYENVQRLQLNVGQILALHGPRVANLTDLRRAAGG